MIAINSIRNTVLYLLEKNSRGFIKPEAFNSFCQLAQFSIFEDLFYQYNAWLNKQNRRLSNSGYADIPQNIKEQIDVFATYSNPSNFTLNATTGLWSYTSNDLYRHEFLSLVNSSTGKKTDIEEAFSGAELNRVINNSATTPTKLFPIYERVGSDFKVYPIDITGNYVELFFIRKPKEPKWTYVVSQGNPVYNASDPLLQNIELHPSLFERFIVKVCGYCGVSIKAEDVIQVSAGEDAKITAKEA